jgi:hypothetical protein
MKRMASSDSAHSLVLDECDKLLAATQGRNILPSSEIMNHALDIAQASRRANDEYQKLLVELTSAYDKLNGYLASTPSQ